MFDQLSSLDTSKTSWKIKARVTRMWPSVSNSSNGNEGAIKGYNLILLDDEDSHVHAFVYADNWKFHADKIVEGGVFVFSNFYAKEALGSLKPVSSTYRINFSPSTNVERVADDFMIARHKFEFVDLSDLFGVASAFPNPDLPEYSTDVIGVLEEFEPVSKISTMYGPKDIAKFRLTDGRDSQKVTIWGNLAVTTDSRLNEIRAGCAEGSEEPVIVICSSTKLKIFRSSVQISTLPASKIYLNLDIDVVHAMRQRLREEGYVPSNRPISSPSRTEESSAAVIEIVSLKELSERTSTDYLKMNFICNVQVKSIEENDPWWYGSCSKNSCHEEVIKYEGKYRCMRCNQNYPVPQKRFKIVILAEDSTDAFNVVLYDRAAKRLLGKTATKLIAEGYNDPATYPPVIKDIAGKHITVRIELNDDNILLNSTVYYATDAYDRAVNSDMFPGTSQNGASGSNATDSDVVEIGGNENTPPSAVSSTKRIKTEK